MDNWIRRRRKELKLTQDEVATRLQLNGFDVSRSTYGHWDANRHSPPLQDPIARQAIADALELNVHEMLIMAGYEIREEESEIALRAAIIISKLPEELQTHALEYLKLLEKQAKATTS